MPVFIPYIPPVQSEPAGPPAWLKLEPGEVFVRNYGAATGAGGKNQRVIIGIALLTVVMVALQIGALVFPMSQRSAATTSSPDSFPYIIVALIVGILVIAVAALLKYRWKSGALQAVLTNRMLAFKVGKEITGFKLEQIVKLEPAGSKRNPEIQIYIKEHTQPAVALPVPNLESAAAELNAYAIAAGAKLR